MGPSLSALLCLFFISIGILVAVALGIEDIELGGDLLLFIILPVLISVSVALVRHIEKPEGGKTLNEIIKDKESVDSNWDAAAEEARWRNMLEGGRLGQDKIEGKENLKFYIMCLSELDAVNHIVQADCFKSRETFTAEIRYLLDNPTVPSRRFPNLDSESYNRCFEYYKWVQKMYLEMELEDA